MSTLPQDERLDRREHVAPALSPARAESMRHAITTRIATPRPRVKPAVALGVAASVAAAVALGLWWPERSEPTGWAETRLLTHEESSRVTLRDGSSISAAPHTEIELLVRRRDETRLALRRGAASFSVSRSHERHFVVEAGGVEVRVLGTRFTVRREQVGTGDARGERVEVEVQQGRVEVSHAGRTRQLTAGARWVTEETWSEPARELAEPAREPAEPAPDDSASPEAPGAEQQAKGEDGGGAKPRRKVRHRRDAGELFELAAAARRDNDARSAERHYAALIAGYPKDRRAGLAAFELGRLRMDDLGKPRAAARALRRALSTSPSSTFRQDAMARLVLALESAGDVEACQRARARYLEAYPGGRYGADVRRRCR